MNWPGNDLNRLWTDSIVWLSNEEEDETALLDRKKSTASYRFQDNSRSSMSRKEDHREEVLNQYFGSSGIRFWSENGLTPLIHASKRCCNFDRSRFEKLIGNCLAKHFRERLWKCSLGNDIINAQCISAELSKFLPLGRLTIGKYTMVRT